MNIFEEESVVKFLSKRDLLKQYKKAKDYLLAGQAKQVRFKARQPKSSGIFYFRINHQYRALAVFDREGDLIVFEIDDHS